MGRIKSKGMGDYSLDVECGCYPDYGYWPNPPKPFFEAGGYI